MFLLQSWSPELVFTFYKKSWTEMSFLSVLTIFHISSGLDKVTIYTMVQQLTITIKKGFLPFLKLGQ